MELDMSNETDHPSKRRKLDVDADKLSSIDILSTILDDGVYNVELPDTQKTDSHLSSSDYIESQLKSNLDQAVQPNKILLFTVFNPSYPITCDILHKICSPISPVLRVVIFMKNGLVQAMVEFESIDDANAVKENLHGCDIYSSCCTLKIDFSRNSNRLNVFKNNNKTWDYTKDTTNDDSDPELLTVIRPRRVLLEVPSSTSDRAFDNRSNSLHSTEKSNIIPFPLVLPKLMCSTKMLAERKAPTPNDISKPGSVCIVYGFNMNKMNASRVFNLFCLYGNVIRIKFLKTKEGCALVQMGDFLAVERLVSLLHEVTIFGSSLQIHCSKQFMLSHVNTPYQLPDGTSSFQVFSSSNLNRFSTPQMVSKNRIQRPTNTLHFFNCPPNVGKGDIIKIFENNRDHLKPISVKMFPAKSEKSSSGLITFENLEQALEALCIYNHQPVSSCSSKYPYIIKLCFSTSSSSM